MAFVTNSLAAKVAGGAVLPPGLRQPWSSTARST